jgi:hypothetical protein
MWGIHSLASRLHPVVSGVPAPANEEAMNPLIKTLAKARLVKGEEQQEAGNGLRPIRQDQEPRRRSLIRQPPTAEDVRLQAWLTERLAVLHDERHGLWPRLRRFLFCNRLVQRASAGTGR